MIRLLASVLAAATLAEPVPPAPFGGQAAVVAASTVPGSSTRVSAAPRYRRPVPGAVVRGFDDVGQYEAGHRGVDLGTSAGEMVRAAADGTVAFAGSVAGRGVVSIDHPDGIRTTYEPVAASVDAGESLAGGDVIGSIEGAHGTCADGGCLHWGARRKSATGDVYLNPLSLLRPLGTVRLIPWE